MTKWELARYLLDAKKSVDSIMYIADVLPELEHIPVRAYVNSNRQTFYICCCVLLDNVYTEDIKSVDDNNRSQYAVLIQDGLNIYEGLQNRQDSCVRVNVLHNQHIWCQITQASLEQMRELYGTVFKECGCQPKNPVGRIVLELELRGEEP